MRYVRRESKGETDDPDIVILARVGPGEKGTANVAETGTAACNSRAV
jgi:hypothetical protein